MKISLTSAENRRLAERPIPDVRAYDAWLRALHVMWDFKKESFDLVSQLLNHALKITGDNALLYAGLGWSCALSYDFGISHNQETLLRGERYAAKAIEIDPHLGLGHFAMGYVRYKQGNLAEMVRHSMRAVEMDRTTDALWGLSFILSEVGRIDEARQFADMAIAADPLNPMSGFARAAVDFFDGHFNEAAARFKDYVKVAPDFPALLWWLAQALAYAGFEDEARSRFEQVANMHAIPISDLSVLFCQALSGDRNRVQELLASNTRLQEAAKTDEWFPNFIAACLTRVGDQDGALEWLERAIDWGFSNHLFLCEHSRFLAPLRNYPRFQALIERAREKEQMFEV